MLPNSDLLYLYDAKLCNPNGEPHNDNFPRMHEGTQTNWVTCFCLKRYVRRYLQNQGLGILVRKYDDKSLELGGALLEQKVNNNEEAIRQLIDVRYFGGPFALTDKERNKNFHSIKGAIQLTEAFSLNNVEVVSADLTTHFASDEGKGNGTFGDFKFVMYSFLAAVGNINRHQAEKNQLSAEDVLWFDKAIVNGVNQYKSVSKANQESRLYLRVEYKEGRDTSLGDFRDYIDIVEKDDLRSIKDVDIRVDRLVELLVAHKEKIQCLHVYEHPMLKMTETEERFSFQGLNEIIPVKVIELD